MSALRWYQVEALQALNAFYANGGRSGGVSLPTGVGKTRIMIAQADQESSDWSDTRRVAVVLDRDILVEQTERELRKHLPPGTSIGVVKGARNELGAQVLVISIHTMKTMKRLSQLPPIKLAIVDEAHMSVSPTYLKFFDKIGAGQPGGARLSGFSATWTRSDSIGLGDVWQEVVYAKTIAWAIEQGFLVYPRAIQLGEGVDLDDVRTKGKEGDYREGDLGKAVMLEELRDTMVAGVLRHGLGRPGVLFAPTVESAEYFGDGLRAAGIPTEGVYGELAGGERKERHKRHRAGETSILTTCTALAVGWDEPMASLGILLRPVRHEGLFVQMAGRLLRRCPGCAGRPDVHLNPCLKTNALLLDCVRATDDVKLRNAINLSKSVMRETGNVLEEVLPAEPVTRERIVHRRKGSYEVEIVAGADVSWLVGPSGIPFIPVNEKEILFVVQDITGFHVAHHTGKAAPDGNPDGKFLASGLDYDDATEYASVLAEDMGARKRSGRWRRDVPTDKARAYATSQGIQGAWEMNRGELSDAFSVERSRWCLGYFARWSSARMNLRGTQIPGPAFAAAR